MSGTKRKAKRTIKREGSGVQGPGIISIANRQRRVVIAAASYRKLLDRLLTATGRAPALIGLTFVDDSVMRRLNQRHRRIDRATDVLAFPAAPLVSDAAPPALGDIVISAETARRQANGRSAHDLSEECRRLLIHGYLHLLGYDHERSRQEALRMRRMERRLQVLLSSL